MKIDPGSVKVAQLRKVKQEPKDEVVSSATARDSSDGSWTCPRCTLNNSDSLASQCEACGARRPWRPAAEIASTEDTKHAKKGQSAKDHSTATSTVSPEKLKEAVFAVLGGIPDGEQEELTKGKLRNLIEKKLGVAEGFASTRKSEIKAFTKEYMTNPSSPKTKPKRDKSKKGSRSAEKQDIITKSVASSSYAATTALIPSVAVLGDKVKMALRQFGHTSFRHPQQDVVKALMKGKDCFVLMPTGGGKSLCFQLPAVLHKGVTLVVSPLLALMADQVDHLKKLGVKVAALNSQQTVKQSQAVKQALGLVPPPFKVVYVTPETLTSSGFSAILSRLHKHKLLSMIAIDEAHCISRCSPPSLFSFLSFFCRSFSFVPSFLSSLRPFFLPSFPPSSFHTFFNCLPSFRPSFQLGP
jgi:hypothetical protein